MINPLDIEITDTALLSYLTDLTVDVERIKMLTDALRSGEYAQGRHVLKTAAGSFCCLGVACDVYMKETGQGRWTEHNSFVPDDSENFNSSYLPALAANWFGIHYNGFLSETTLLPKGTANDLVQANDYENSFEDIAKAIEGGAVAYKPQGYDT